MVVTTVRCILTRTKKTQMVMVMAMSAMIVQMIQIISVIETMTEYLMKLIIVLIMRTLIN